MAAFRNLSIHGHRSFTACLSSWMCSSLVCRARTMSAIPNYEETDCKLANEERRRESTRVYFVPHHKTQPNSLQEALRALRAYSISKCDETVEVSLFCNLFVNKNRSKRRDPFKGTILFPHAFGKEPKLLVFAKGDSVNVADRAGASIVGGTELVEQIASGQLKHKFDICLAVEDIYDELKKFQKTLRKHMPNPKKGTVVEPSGLTEAVDRLKRSKEYRCDKQGNCNVAIGKLSFDDDDIEENLELLVTHILNHRENQSKNSFHLVQRTLLSWSDTFIESAVLSSTYGPGFPISVQQYLQLDKR